MELVTRKTKRRFKVSTTVEELETELQGLLSNMDSLAQKVREKEIDAYEGFVQSEKYKNRIVEIGNELKAKGIDITKRVE